MMLDKYNRPQSGRTPVQRVSFSIGEVAAATSLSTRTVRRLIADGHLRATKVGGRVLIPAKAVTELVGSGA